MSNWGRSEQPIKRDAVIWEGLGSGLQGEDKKSDTGLGRHVQKVFIPSQLSKVPQEENCEEGAQCRRSR